jgi:hypothetical protein
VHLLRIHVQRPGETAERLLGALAERRGVALFAHGHEYRALRTDGTEDRDQILEDVRCDLDEIAASLGIPRWDTVLSVS